MNRPAGYTLIELLIATASASVLMVGLSATLFTASHALGVDDGATASRNLAEATLARVVADLQEARRFMTLAANEVRFTVPDRDGDGLDEEIYYGWGGASGDPLTRQLNGGAEVPLLSDVRALDFVALTQPLTALDVTIAPLPPWPVLESHATAEFDYNVDALPLPVPAGAMAGELLIAAVAIHNVDYTSAIPPGGWTALDLDENAHVTFGVWWKLATDSEPVDYTWRWTKDEKAIGCMLRISNQYPGTPITTFVADAGKSRTPECPGVTTTLDDSMVIRLGGFHDDPVTTVGENGIPGHTDVYLNHADKICVGCAYQIVNLRGPTPAVEFDLKNSIDYRVLSLVVAPKP